MLKMGMEYDNFRSCPKCGYNAGGMEYPLRLQQRYDKPITGYSMISRPCLPHSTRTKSGNYGA